VAVLYYAGHGVEVDQTNYLIPVDARLATDFDIEDETLPLDRVLQAMEPARRLRLVLLDACRENPFLKSMKRTVATRSVGRGLGRVEPAAANTLIAFATKPNAIAEDGKGPNSPFTAALVRHLLTPGLDLRIALGKVRDEVMASTGGRQEPYVTSSLGGDVVAIVPGVGGAVMKLVRPELSHGSAPLTAVKERALKPKDTFKECTACPEMVVVPSGSFVMGSYAGEEGRRNEEGPQHQISITRPFALGKFEVTFAEWDACVVEGGCQHQPGDQGWGRGKRPVINVSWNDITGEYLPWLNRKTGKAYRLPTEAEWEYAARAGTTTRYAFGDTIGTTQAQYSPEGAFAGKTAAVGSFQANRFNLYDVHGNVWEWVQDCWNASYDFTPSNGSASQIGDCSRRLLRGGAWANGPVDLRSAARFPTVSVIRLPFVGFRVLRRL
jgi:formylglycine-generating enzyme required for sulfatase activity